MVLGFFLCSCWEGGPSKLIGASSFSRSLFQYLLFVGSYIPCMCSFKLLVLLNPPFLSIVYVLQVSWNFLILISKIISSFYQKKKKKNFHNFGEKNETILQKLKRAFSSEVKNVFSLAIMNFLPHQIPENIYKNIYIF